MAPGQDTSSSQDQPQSQSQLQPQLPPQSGTDPGANKPQTPTPETKTSIMKFLETAAAIGPATSDIIYSAGYTTYDRIKRATVDELVSIRGITVDQAIDIIELCKAVQLTGTGTGTGEGQSLEGLAASGAVMAAKEAVVQQVLEEIDEPENVIARLKQIPGIGLSVSQSVYDGGYTNLTKLAQATPEDLEKVEMITPGMARKIVDGLQSLPAPGEPLPPPAEPSAPEPGKEEPNFFSKMITKVKSWFKKEEKKEAAPPAEATSAAVVPQPGAEPAPPQPAPAPGTPAPQKPEGEAAHELFPVTAPAPEEGEAKTTTTTKVEGDSITIEVAEKSPIKAELAVEEAGMSKPPEEGLIKAAKEKVAGPGLDVPGGEQDEGFGQAIAQLRSIKGVGVKIANELYEAGYRTLEDLQDCTADDLNQISGITTAKARQILREVRSRTA